MCGSKPKIEEPAPPPAAPPEPAETATGFASAGTANTDTKTINARRRGVDSLRVDLNIPNGQQGGAGAYVP